MIYSYNFASGRLILMHRTRFIQNIWRKWPKSSIFKIYIYCLRLGLWSDGCYFPIWSETISDNLKSKPTWVTPQAGPMIEHLQKSVISVIEDWQHGARRQISCRAQGLTSKKLLSPGSDQRELVAYNSQGLSGHAAVQDQGHIGQQPHLQSVICYRGTTTIGCK